MDFHLLLIVDCGFAQAEAAAGASPEPGAAERVWAPDCAASARFQPRGAGAARGEQMPHPLRTNSASERAPGCQHSGPES